MGSRWEGGTVISLFFFCLPFVGRIIRQDGFHELSRVIDLVFFFQAEDGIRDRSRHPAEPLFRSRKLSLRRKRSSPNVFEMAATETITSIILIKLIRVSLGTVRHPRRFKIVVIDIQITLKQMLRDFIGIRVNRAKKSGMVN